MDLSIVSVWKPQNQHGHCSVCQRAVMMWIRWKCKACDNLVCYECYNAILCDVIKHPCNNDADNVAKDNFEQGNALKLLNEYRVISH